jgi:hypothetical protein
MTIQTQLLEFRLAQLQAKAQELLAGRPAPGGVSGDVQAWLAGPQVMAFRTLLDGAQAELCRMLRQFEGLDRELDGLRAALDAAPHDQRGHAQARIDGLEGDLVRVYRRAARLAAALIDLARSSGGVAAVELVQGVTRLGAELARPLDTALVRQIVQQIGTQPVFEPPVSAWADSPSWLETVFIAIAVVATLARPRRPAAP